MEPVSLALGIASLILPAFSATVGCLEAIRNFQDVDDKSALFNCMLQIEQYNLMEWGRRCGMLDNTIHKHIPNEEAQILALNLVH